MNDGINYYSMITNSTIDIAFNTIRKVTIPILKSGILLFCRRFSYYF